MWSHDSKPMMEWLESLRITHGSAVEYQTRTQVARQESRWGRHFGSQHVVHVFRESKLLLAELRTIARLQFILDEGKRVVIPSASLFLDSEEDWCAEHFCEAMNEVAVHAQDMDLMGCSEELGDLASDAVLMAESELARLRLYRFPRNHRVRGGLTNLKQRPAYALTAVELLQAARDRMWKEEAHRLPSELMHLPGLVMPALVTSARRP